MFPSRFGQKNLFARKNNNCAVKQYTEKLVESQSLKHENLLKNSYEYEKTDSVIRTWFCSVSKKKLLIVLWKSPQDRFVRL